MYGIIQVTDLELNSDGDIEIKAIVEDMVLVPGSQTLIDPPEYAPCLCQATIWKEYFLPDTELRDDRDYLKELIIENNLLKECMWEPIIEDDSDRYLD